MTKPVFLKFGKRFDGYQKGPARLKDLKPEEVARKEACAPVFSTGWTARLEQRGLLIKVGEQQSFWFVARSEAIEYLQCTVDTLRKTLERHYWLYALAPDNYHVAAENGFVMEKVANQKRRDGTPSKGKKRKGIDDVDSLGTPGLAPPVALPVHRMTAEEMAAAAAIPVIVDTDTTPVVAPVAVPAGPVSSDPAPHGRKRRHHSHDSADEHSGDRRKRSRKGRSEDESGDSSTPPPLGAGKRHWARASAFRAKSPGSSAGGDDYDTETTDEIAAAPGTSRTPIKDDEFGEFGEDGRVSQWFDRSRTSLTLSEFIPVAQIPPGSASGSQDPLLQAPSSQTPASQSQQALVAMGSLDLSDAISTSAKTDNGNGSSGGSGSGAPPAAPTLPPATAAHDDPSYRLARQLSIDIKRQNSVLMHELMAPLVPDLPRPLVPGASFGTSQSSQGPDP
eukprot:m51a1_g6331 hypothetical protein (449) ;mRNA; f:12246-14097